MLTAKEVQHIARLARLTLKNVEVGTYAKQLSEVLNYFEQLHEVNVREADYDYQVAGLANVTRIDVVEDGGEDQRRKLIDAFPARSGDELRVPGVFGEENDK